MKREPNHPTLEDLAHWVLEPDADPARDTARHAAGCRDCTGLAQDLRRLAESASSAVAAEPPQDVLERARALIHRAEPLVLVAELIEDTREPAGVRGTLDARYLLFRAGDFEIDLRMDEGGELRGQIHGPLSADLGNVDISAHRGRRAVESASTDDHGEFRLAGIAPPFFLRMVGESIRVRTPDILP